MSPRLSSEERRTEILQTVQTLFAERGFHGVTTRHLAEAAGVSEALLFKYFPTKERLYAEMLKHVCSHCADERAQWKQLPASTMTLVLMVHRLMHLLAGGAGDAAGDRKLHNKLMLQSLLADGEFARQFLGIVSESTIDALARSLLAAGAAGDCGAPAGDATEARLRAWVTLHGAVMTMLYRLPSSPAVDYGLSLEQVASGMTAYALRGLGLSDAAIARYYQPEALAVLDR
jgi:AcrR family transcriptional regulator